MLFRPTYCANCGDKIERVEWRLFTSRRFCGVCESEFKGTDLIPRVIVAVSLLAGAAGITGYLRSGPAAKDLVVRDARKAVTQAATTPSMAAESNVRVGNANAVSTPSAAGSVINSVPGPAAGLAPVKPIAEALYFCGAATKKGTPCSRKVKGNVRCFQHTGLPAMLPPDKLRAN